MGWLYQLFPVNPFSVLLGVFEVTAALLLAIKPVAPKLSIIGSLMAIVLFLNTTSFLFTTLGVGELAGGGCPALSLTGEFLLKDMPLAGPVAVDTRRLHPGRQAAPNRRLTASPARSCTSFRGVARPNRKTGAMALPAFRFQ